MFNVLEFKLEARSELIYILHPGISRELTECGLAGIKKTWHFLNIQTLGSGFGMYGVSCLHSKMSNCSPNADCYLSDSVAVSDIMCHGTFSENWTLMASDYLGLTPSIIETS